MNSAAHWRRDGTAVVCELCPHACRLADGQRGRCGVRQATPDGLVSLNDGVLAAAADDPVEKKPFYHFLPGSRIFSVAAPGCNFTCRQCQNYHLSDDPRRDGVIGRRVAAAQVVAAAEHAGCPAVAYTYSEPTVWFEFMLAMARAARARGLRNAVVSNAYISPAAQAELLPLLDAANYDLKSFGDDTYRTVYGGTLAPVLATITAAVRAGVWVEVTTLVIPGINDSDGELRDIACWLADLSPEVPWHLSAFFPTHRLTDREATPAATLTRARAIGRAAGLRFVYTGNIRDDEGGTTYCPGCGAAVITRDGFRVTACRLREGRCAACGGVLAGRWR
ncbi:MAG TPA: AmmeMemoRadiSam system radical SAM enzyme [bacterium]|nr:AmmeMemoRadiSam system radical SAM enzyme [bacterium]